jgi:hypothetical protein
MGFGEWTPSELAPKRHQVIPVTIETESMISGGSKAAAGGADNFARAYHALRTDPSVQFNLAPPNAPPQTPPWLHAILKAIGHTLAAIGRFLNWIGGFFPETPVARFLLWAVIALAATALVWVMYNRIRHGEWRFKLSRLGIEEHPEVEEEWVPQEAGARSWLEEADALAAERRFAEAIHHLLFRSVEDIAKRRPSLVRPALTSRELGAAEGVPARARELFSRIARSVERSLFGGRAVRQGDWLKARQAYSDFVMAAAWRA